MFAKSERAGEDNAVKARSPMIEAPSEMVNRVQTNSHRDILAICLDTESEKKRKTAMRMMVLPRRRSFN